jgi:hypothetical protein
MEIKKIWECKNIAGKTTPEQSFCSVQSVLTFVSITKHRRVWEDQEMVSFKTSLTLREEHRPRVFENKVLRKIFGPKRDEATGEWRRLHNEELYGLYSSPSIIREIKSRRMRWAGHLVRCIQGFGRGT